MAGPRPIIPGPNEKRLQNQFPKEVMKPQPSEQVWPVEMMVEGLSSYSFFGSCCCREVLGINVAPISSHIQDLSKL